MERCFLLALRSLLGQKHTSQMAEVSSLFMYVILHKHVPPFLRIGKEQTEDWQHHLLADTRNRDHFVSESRAK